MAAKWAWRLEQGAGTDISNHTQGADTVNLTRAKLLILEPVPRDKLLPEGPTGHQVFKSLRVRWAFLIQSTTDGMLG